MTDLKISKAFFVSLRLKLRTVLRWCRFYLPQECAPHALVILKAVCDGNCLDALIDGPKNITRGMHANGLYGLCRGRAHSCHILP